MRILRQPVVLLGFLSLVLAATEAAGNTSTIKILNDGPDELVTTVYDLNAQPPGPVVENQRIEGFAWISVLVTADAAGKTNLRWMAQTTDDAFSRCGHRQRRVTADHAIVRVFAEYRCSDGAS